MDAQLVNYAAGIFAAAMVGLSYLRFRHHADHARKGDDNALGSSVDVKQTMAKTWEYFDASPCGGGNRLSEAFDLAPMKMLSGLCAPARGKGKRGERRRERNA